jgi:branched-chain amino acid transport system ATP-binding protein
MTTPPLLDVQHMSRRFGGLDANADVSISVAQGEIVGLIGPNGAGKSTLFNVIAGSLPASEGTVVFDGADVTALPATARCARGIARTFQVVRSFESMSVIDNVIVGALVRTRSTYDARRNAHKVLAFTDLDHRADAPAHELTPSEKRRLEVARALATTPKLLLLDEVMAGLTPVEARKGVDLVRRIRDTGVTVLMVEHVMEIVLPLVDRAVVLHLGRVLAQGQPADIARDPRVIGAYLGERHRDASA